MQSNFDVIIIGAGVAGMTAAIYLKRAGISCCLIEKEIYGGQINLSPKVENFPGFLEISGNDLSNSIYEQIKQLKIDYFNEEVVKIECFNNVKQLKTKNNTYFCKYIIIATGRIHKKLNVIGEDNLVGKGISYCATCDGNFFKNKDVAVVGGGNSAFIEALYLSGICSSVTIINRSDKLRAEEKYIEEVNSKNNIKILYNTTVDKFNDNNGFLESIELNTEGNKTQLYVKGCFISIGCVPSTNLFGSSLSLDENGYIKVDENNETNIKSIYAAGDVVNKCSFQLITAMNDGVIAAVSCINNIKNKSL